MKVCYQVATPDVEIAPSVTAFQGDLETSLGTLGDLGFDGVEFMTISPKKLDWSSIEKLLSKNNLELALVCTGEIYGQHGLTFTDPKVEVRQEAILRVKQIIDFAAFFGANINIGRVRGQYLETLPRGITYQYAVEAFREIAEYGHRKNIQIALEPVTYLQTNFINTVREAINICNDVDSEMFKIMLDIFHMNIEEKDIYKAIEEGKSHTIHVHLADNNRRYPGMGGLDFKRILKTLKDTGYDGPICTEIYQLPNQLEAAEGTVIKLKSILENL